MDNQLLSILIAALFGSGGVFMILSARSREQATTLKLISEIQEKQAVEFKANLEKIDRLEKELVETKKQLKEFEQSCGDCLVKPIKKNDVNRKKRPPR